MKVQILNIDGSETAIKSNSICGDFGVVPGVTASDKQYGWGK